MHNVGFTGSRAEQYINLEQLVYKTDPFGKALTGRTPERIEDETGIKKELIFPPDGKILYVGDPWQRMGKELDESHGSNLTIIDYEFGETASFETDDEKFRERIQYKAETNIKTVTDFLEEAEDNDLNSKDIDWLQVYRTKLHTAHALSESAVSDTDYSQAAEAWGALRDYIEKIHRAELMAQEQQSTEPGDPLTRIEIHENEALAYFRTDAWYMAVDGERGFRDIPDWKNIIYPKLENKRSEMYGLPEKELEHQLNAWKKSYIDEIRLEKMTEHTNVVQAIFPQLPFANESFDRFVASWSISAHTFSELDKDGFDLYWEEILRVLKVDGEAYIFPLNYYWEPDVDFIDSLIDLSKTHPEVQWCILDGTGEICQINSPSDVYGDEFTLIIYKEPGVTDQ